MSRSRLTTTTYGILGLLAVRPHSTYELATAMERSVGRVWPRSQSKLYEEPKKLLEHGYAEACEEFVGRRPRTLYTITQSGRRALAAWLCDAGDGPSLEFEGLVKLLFAEHGAREDALASITRARKWAEEMNAGNIEAAERFLEGDGLHPQRRATTLLVGAFLTDFYALVASWAEWAAAEVAEWPDDLASHELPPDRIRQVLKRARWSETAEN
jgi:DNA-binding PadR family transcriptional regulator